MSTHMVSTAHEVSGALATVIVQVLASQKRAGIIEDAFEEILSCARMIAQHYDSLPPEAKHSPYPEVSELLKTLLTEIAYAEKEIHEAYIPDTEVIVRF